MIDAAWLLGGCGIINAVSELRRHPLPRTCTQRIQGDRGSHAFVLAVSPGSGLGGAGWTGDSTAGSSSSSRLR